MLLLSALLLLPGFCIAHVCIYRLIDVTICGLEHNLQLLEGASGNVHKLQTVSAMTHYNNSSIVGTHLPGLGQQYGTKLVCNRLRYCIHTILLLLLIILLCLLLFRACCYATNAVL